MLGILAGFSRWKTAATQHCANVQHASSKSPFLLDLGYWYQIDGNRNVHGCDAWTMRQTRSDVASPSMVQRAGDLGGDLHNFHRNQSCKHRFRLRNFRGRKKLSNRRQCGEKLQPCFERDELRCSDRRCGVENFHPRS